MSGVSQEALAPEIEQIIEMVTAGFRAELADIMRRHQSRALTYEEQLETLADLNGWRNRALSAENSLATEAATRAPLEAELAQARARIEALKAHTKHLIQLAVDGGLTNDLMAELYPEQRNRSGQPRDEFARRARRVVNEARAVLGGEHG